MTASRLGSSRTHGHEHKDMRAVLHDYGADHVPDTLGRWRAMKCPFHDDGSASAQTDGVGFRCFTCDVFYPAPLVLLKDREGLDLDGAHDRYHSLAGAGGVEVRGSNQFGFDVPRQQRYRADSRRTRQARRRS